MIYVLNDIKFGHPKLGKYQLEYIENILFHSMLLDSIDGKIVITGDLFYNNKLVTFSLLNQVREIFDQSPLPIEIVGNDYCYKLFNFKKIEKIDFDTSNFALFQINKEDKSKIGFNILYENEIRFFKNDSTPRFTEYQINSIEDLEKIKINNDFIDLTINGDLLQNQQNKNIIDLFLNNNTFNNVYYTEKIKDNDKVKMDSSNIKIRDVLINNIGEDLKEELIEIFTIYDNKTFN